MTTSDARKLIEKGINSTQEKSVWADLGCGNGTFTKALAELIGEGSTIYAIDQTQAEHFPTSDKTEIKFLKADFEKDALSFSKIDGILMANSLHYIKGKRSLLQKLKQHLHETGQLIIIEYDTEASNAWVPYPIPFQNLKEMLEQAGFKHIQKIGERQSIYRREKMYACVSEKE